MILVAVLFPDPSGYFPGTASGYDPGGGSSLDPGGDAGCFPEVIEICA